jgi:pantetheine-phosphate adenylyltransferase
MPGQVIFIGAGPGAADLITLRGARLLAQAEVVLFDALTDPALREHAPQAQWIDVGKRGFHHATGQMKINGLLVKFAAQMGASMIIRGLRAVSDFEYEFQMVAMNQRLNTEIETVFLMADPRHQAISSKLVKEIAVLDGDISPFTTPAVAQALINRSKEKT